MATPQPVVHERLEGELGKYVVLEKLAAGGMAEIYLARATGIEGFEKHVVIKRILPHFAEQPRFVQMFLDEARLAAKLHHQNIAQVYDIGRSGTTHYFAMEYLHGVDLRALLKETVRVQRPLPLEHALTVIAGAAAGLDYAHNAKGPKGPLNIVHRDISPSNIFVTYEGGVKVVDFGIARATSRSAETQTGTLKGKISYMSPEQCEGKDLDRRGDIFCLGIVLYEITTQSRLFRARHETDYVVMDRIVNGDFEPPSMRRRNYSSELERIVMKALAVDANDRYPSAAEMLGDIEQFAAREGLPLSTRALSQYVTGLFGDVPVPWLVERDPEPADTERPRTISITNVPAHPQPTRDTIEARPRPEPLSDPSVEIVFGDHKPHRRWWVAGALVTAAAAGLLAALLLGGSKNEHDKAPLPAASATKPETSSAPPATTTPRAAMAEPAAETADAAPAAADEPAVAAAAPPTNAATKVDGAPPAKVGSSPGKVTRRARKARAKPRKTRRRPKKTKPKTELLERRW